MSSTRIPKSTAESHETKPVLSSENSNASKSVANGSTRQLGLGLLFGLIFGFLLQKGGVAKYHILIGVLLLEDFTVVKVMLTAVISGGIGIFALHSMNLVKLHLKPTRYAANIIGGLIFGVGFGLLGYCPGTGAAAIGQGNLDAIPGILGLMAGSWLFAEMSGWVDSSLNKIGDRGKLTLNEVVGMRRSSFLLIFIPVLIAALITIDRLAVR